MISFQRMMIDMGRLLRHASRYAWYMICLMRLKLLLLMINSLRLLKGLDWTRYETAQEPRPCADREERGNFSPLRLLKRNSFTQLSKQGVELIPSQACVNNLTGDVAQ